MKIKLIFIRTDYSLMATFFKIDGNNNNYQKAFEK
jgi:hypothetical protein